MPPSEKIKVIELMTSLRNEISGKMESWESLQEIHNTAHVGAIQQINKLMEHHVEDDKENFGSLAKAIKELSATTSALQATVEGLRGAFIPWPWFIGTMITLLIIVGGAIGGVYLKLDSFGDRIDGIEFAANLSE
jgi:hypothetical protein